MKSSCAGKARAWPPPNLFMKTILVTRLSLSRIRSSKFLLSNIGVGIGTLLSRVTGFGKVLALTYAVGLSGLSDVFNTANTTPNIIYELLLGGVLSATLLPTFVRALKNDDREAMSAIISTIIVCLSVITFITIAAAPWIMSLYSMTRADHPAEFNAVGTHLIRYLMPQIFFYGLIAVSTSYLNAQHRVILPAYVPILNNLIAIAALLMLPSFFQEAPTLDLALSNHSFTAYLGLGATLGIAVSALVLSVPLLRSGLKLSLRPNWHHPAVRDVLRLSGWTLGYVIANQVALFIVSLIALHREGWMTAYQTAFTFFILPHGLLAMTITTTFMPKIANDAASGDMDSFRSRMVEGIRWLVFLILPAAAGYMLVARPLLAVLLNHGHFTLEAALLTGDTLKMFAVGLLPFSLYLFLLRGFYALSDTRTPFYLNVFENVINIALALPLAMMFGVMGLALAYSLSYIAAAILTFYVLNKRVGGHLMTRSLQLQIYKITFAVLVMVVGVSITLSLTDTLGLWTQLCSSILVGVILYGALSLPMIRSLYPATPKAEPFSPSGE